MSLQITKIEIKNFRSIQSLSMSPQKLAVLVGTNDTGKSNILRALNLFFNGKTSLIEGLKFNTDHNIFDQPNRKAKEIIVKLHISLPDTYKETNGDIIIWEKRWRNSGIIRDEYKGSRQTTGTRGGKHNKDVNIPDRSNVHSLLRNIKFVYVSAIKDSNYFSKLRASIYEIIAEVAEHELRDSSQGFESSISRQLDDLTKQIAESLGLQSRLALPKNLSHIFESLDFLSKEHNISLDSRGDGIKARHIPLILEFMAKKKRKLSGRGAQPYNFIWGYEEPENSLEISNSIALADQFWSFLDDSVSQIFLTTHSPIFYNLHKKSTEESRKSTSCHHIYNDADETGTKTTTEFDNLDERMGATALYAPIIAEFEDKIRQKEKQLEEAKRIAENNRPQIFVEGPSDKLIIQKALDVFAPEFKDRIDVVTINSGGHNYVIDMLQAWHIHAKHYRSHPRAAGLVDLDAEAKKNSDEWNKNNRNISHAKCFTLPKPPHIIPALRANFKIPVVLEILYDKAAWEWAEQKGYLEERELDSIISKDLKNRIFRGEDTLDERLDNEWAIFVKKTFHSSKKVSTANHFSMISDDNFRSRFSILEETVNKVIEYLINRE